MNHTPDTNRAWLSKRADVRARRGRVRNATPRPDTAVDLASNDYLGLARDLRLQHAATEAIISYGCSATASRVVTGTTKPHVLLEDSLAAFCGFQRCLTFSSGYLANLTTLTALSGPDSVLFLDAHAHASLQDGSHLARGRREVFAHNDLDVLDQALSARSESRAIVVVESIYSVLGDQAPLVELYDLCVDHDAWLVVDEAHGLGVRGNGKGLCAEHGLTGRERLVVTATLSKALGSQGGAVLGEAQVISHLVNEGRGFIFDTGLAPASAAAATTALKIIESEPERVDEVASAADEISDFWQIPTAAGAVQSLPMPSAEVAYQVAQLSRESGVLVGCFRPPSVPDGVSRLRFTAKAGQSSPVRLEALDVVLEHLNCVTGKTR